MKKSSSRIIIFVILTTIWLLLAPLSNAQCVGERFLLSPGPFMTQGAAFVGASEIFLDSDIPIFSRNVQGRVLGTVDASLVVNPKFYCEIVHAANVANNPGDSIAMKLRILIDGAERFSQTFTDSNDPDTPFIFEVPLPMSSSISYEFQLSIDIAVAPEDEDGEERGPKLPTYGVFQIKPLIRGGFSKAGFRLPRVDGQSVPGGTLLVTGEGWEVGSETAEYRLLFDGMQVAQQGPGLPCTQQPSMSFDVPCDTVSGSHTIAIQLFDIAVQRVLAFNVNPTTLNINADFTAGNCSATKVASVEFKPMYSDSLLEPNSLQGGLKIFPDKNSPADSLDRRKVKVKAITDVPATSQKAKVFFRSFDVDDPSPDGIIDPNGSDGDDNRGMPKEGIFSINGAPMGRSASVETVPDPTTGKQVAEVEFIVTMHPGDNFRIAAGTDQQLLDSVEVEGTNLKGPDGILSENTAETAQAKATPLLTVWRRLHVELDFMDKVTGNQVSGRIRGLRPNPKGSTAVLDVDVALPLEEGRFEKGRIIIPIDEKMLAFSVITNRRDDTRRIDAVEISGLRSVPPGKLVNQPFLLVDDDDFNSDDGINLDGDNNEPIVAFPQTFSLMQESDDPALNAFADACIRPIYDGGGNPGNNNPDISFKLNIDSKEDFDAQVTSGRGSERSEADDFWVIYVQIGYQGPLDKDGDGTNDDITATGESFGITTDIVQNDLQVPLGGEASLIYQESIRDAIPDSITVPHEAGHQFGLKGDRGGFGIMSSGLKEPPERAHKFVSAHINVLRWRVKSPGQPRQ